MLAFDIFDRHTSLSTFDMSDKQKVYNADDMFDTPITFDTSDTQ